MAEITTARFSSSAALTLWKTTGTPMLSISSRTALAVATELRRSRWTPMMPKPARAQAFAAAAPKPLLAPSTSAQHSRPSHVNVMITSHSQCTGVPPRRAAARCLGRPGRRGRLG